MIESNQQHHPNPTHDTTNDANESVVATPVTTRPATRTIDIALSDSASSAVPIEDVSDGARITAVVPTSKSCSRTRVIAR